MKIFESGVYIWTIVVELTMALNVAEDLKSPAYLARNKLVGVVDTSGPVLKLHFPLSKNLVLHNAFVDDRPRNGHSNVTMIFLIASKRVINEKLITRCGVGKSAVKSFHLRYFQQAILMHKWLGLDKFKYEQLILECYDVPVTSGEKAFVRYRAHPDQLVVVRTTNPVVIPAPRVSPKGPHDLSVVVCTKAHNREVTWLPEFLRYQKTLGVDHVHLTVLDQFIKDNGLMDYLSNNRFFIEQYKEQYISVQVWKE